MTKKRVRFPIERPVRTYYEERADRHMRERHEALQEAIRDFSEYLQVVIELCVDERKTRLLARRFVHLLDELDRVELAWRVEHENARRERDLMREAEATFEPVDG